MTFSIVARCAESGQFGVAISSSSPAVAARCSFARAGIGAVATQNVTNPMLGPEVLDLMAKGETAETAGSEAIKAENFPDYRQLLVVGSKGAGFIHSGAQALGTWAAVSGNDCVSGGNLLADTGVPDAIVAGFEATDGELGDRLVASLVAGLAAGGEAGPVHSAGLLIVDRQAWPYAELRCDWTNDCPISAIASAWDIYKPQAEDYVTRALNPTAAPSYGVPGDE
mgnify:CR=1 FL=1